MKVAPLRLQPGDDLRLALAQLRLAGATQATVIHLHIAIADTSGAVIDGHLCAGSLVRTKAEPER